MVAKTPGSISGLNTSNLLYNPLTNTYLPATAAVGDQQSPGSVEASVAMALDPVGLFDRVRTPGAGRLITQDEDLLVAILAELRAIKYILIEGLNTTGDPDALAQDSLVYDNTVTTN